MCRKQQQHQQQCDCVLGVCSCSRDLTHDDPADAAAVVAAADTDAISDSSMAIPCSIDISSTSSFLPRTHPLFSKSRCLRTQQYATAKDQVLLATALFSRFITCCNSASVEHILCVQLQPMVEEAHAAAASCESLRGGIELLAGAGAPCSTRKSSCRNIWRRAYMCVTEWRAHLAPSI
jgi:hypothetical protein